LKFYRAQELSAANCDARLAQLNK